MKKGRRYSLKQPYGMDTWLAIHNMSLISIWTNQLSQCQLKDSILVLVALNDMTPFIPFNNATQYWSIDMWKTDHKELPSPFDYEKN